VNIYKTINIIYIIISLIFISMVYFPVNNFTLIGDKVKILNNNKVVQIGDKVHYELSYHKRFDIPSLLTRSVLIDNGYYISEKTIISSVPAGTNTVVSTFKIPNTDFMLGKTKLIIKFEYTLFGGLRTINGKIESEEFTIVK